MIPKLLMLLVPFAILAWGLYNLGVWPSFLAPRCKLCGERKVWVFCGGGYNIHTWECRCETNLESFPPHGFTASDGKFHMYPVRADQCRKKRKIP